MAFSISILEYTKFLAPTIVTTLASWKAPIHHVSHCIIDMLYSSFGLLIVFHGDKVAEVRLPPLPPSLFLLSSS